MIVQMTTADERRDYDSCVPGAPCPTVTRIPQPLLEIYAVETKLATELPLFLPEFVPVPL